jgi:ferredoxin
MPRLIVEGYDGFEVEGGTTLLDACEAAGVPMECACGGFASCNSCRVVVIGDGRALSPLLEEEKGFLDAPGQRLGCQAEVLADVMVRLHPGE